MIVQRAEDGKYLYAGGHRKRVQKSSMTCSPDHFAVWQSNAILARSGEAGKAIVIFARADFVKRLSMPYYTIFYTGEVFSAYFS
jgi:hypothetical protein